MEINSDTTIFMRVNLTVVEARAIHRDLVSTLNLSKPGELLLAKLADIIGENDR